MVFGTGVITCHWNVKTLPMKSCTIILVCKEPAGLSMESSESISAIDNKRSFFIKQ